MIRYLFALVLLLGGSRGAGWDRLRAPGGRELPRPRAQAGPPAPRLPARDSNPRDSILAEGIRLAALHPDQAIPRFETLLAADSSDVAANWRAALALNDCAQLLGPDSAPRRDSLFLLGTGFARRAVALAPTEAPALFALGVLLGNTALTKGARAKIRAGGEVYDLATRAIAADSTHDGAHHLLGRWHYEVMTLSGFQRFIARTFLGGKVLGQASWDEARRHLERAVALDSTRIYHRLDLAKVLLARKDTAGAVGELERIATLPDRTAADPGFRREAGELLARIAKKE